MFLRCGALVTILILAGAGDLAAQPTPDATGTGPDTGAAETGPDTDATEASPDTDATNAAPADDHDGRPLDYSVHDGLLVRCEDVDALAAAMERLVRDDKLRAQLAKNAPQVSERFSLQKIVSKWDALIDRVVN